MFKIKAKIKFKHNSFDIIEHGDQQGFAQFQIKKDTLKDLNYWDVDLQEAYSFPDRSVSLKT